MKGSTIAQLMKSYRIQYRGGWRPKRNASVERVGDMLAFDREAKRLRDFNEGNIEVISRIDAN